MSNRIQSIKGMNDLFEEALATWRHVEDTARAIFLRYGYGEIRTPTLEETQLFVRSVGEASDIVHKEMYTFLDGGESAKGGTQVTLRPENTAGVVRALVQHGRLPADAEARVFYIGPMFRRERPQKGRYRQFHQLGAEAFGLTDASIDVEMMAMLHHFVEELGLSGVKLVLNSLGDAADRPPYLEALTAYFTAHKDKLSEDSQRRLELNPLRILDSKSEGDRALIADAPKPLEHLGDAAKAHFDEVLSGLEKLGVPYEVDDKLVRGLDYYTRTVFEVLAETGLGAQNAVAAGGRYDDLVETLGGRPTPGIGFAAGIERIVLLLEEAGKAVEPAPPALMLVGADDEGRAQAHALAAAVRRLGVSVEVDHRGRKVKAQLKRADRAQIALVGVIGDRERAEGKVGLKKMSDGSVHEVALEAEALAAAARGLS
jgi:histidyl-tRNA synthetase